MIVCSAFVEKFMSAIAIFCNCKKLQPLQKSAMLSLHKTATLLLQKTATLLLHKSATIHIKKEKKILKKGKERIPPLYNHSTLRCVGAACGCPQITRRKAKGTPKAAPAIPIIICERTLGKRHKLVFSLSYADAACGVAEKKVQKNFFNIQRVCGESCHFFAPL
jgi:hypothetical protein